MNCSVMRCSFLISAGVLMASCNSGVNNAPDEIVVLECSGTDPMVSNLAPDLGPFQSSYAFNAKTGELWVYSERENDWVDACQESDCSVSITPDAIRVQSGFIEKETSYWIDRRSGRWSPYPDGICRRVETEYGEEEQIF